VLELKEMTTLPTWPATKRKVNFKTIEQDLYTYYAMKKQLQEIEEDIEAIAYPQAAGGEVGYVILGRQINKKGQEEEIRAYDFVCSHSEGQTSDPTENRAQRLWEYRQNRMSSLAFSEMVRRIAAIDYMLNILRERTIRNDGESQLRLRLIEEKYFKRKLTDCGIWESLNVSRRTFYRWQYQTIKMVADQLGIII
jgi:hypothetical protein